MVSAPVARTLAATPMAAVGQHPVVGTRRVRVVGVLPDRAGRDEAFVMLPLALLVALTPDAQEPHALLAQAPDIDAVEPLKAVATRRSRSWSAESAS